MNPQKLCTLGAGLLLSVACTQAQTKFAGWDFTSTVAAPDNNPAPTTGTGTASIIGMSGNNPSGDILSTPGTANPSFSEFTWRVRGGTANGWVGTAAQYSQGAEFDVSTVGYTGVALSFDWYSTAQGIRDLQVQYNANINNASGWVNIGGTSSTGTYIATAKDFYNAPGSPTITLSLGSVANNDANFGIRLVSAYDSTGNLTGQYASSTLVSGSTVAYNGTSGNWRFDNIDLTGTALVTPEPSTLALIGMGVSALALQMRRRKA